jgi:hypothetical protein
MVIVDEDISTRRGVLIAPRGCEVTLSFLGHIRQFSLASHKCSQDRGFNRRIPMSDHLVATPWQSPREPRAPRLVEPSSMSVTFCGEKTRSHASSGTTSVSSFWPKLNKSTLKDIPDQ